MRSDESVEHPHPPWLLRGWVLCAVTVLAVLTGVVVWTQTRPTLYTSTAVVAFTPTASRPVSATVVVLTAPRYVAYGTSPYVLRQVAEPLRVDSVVLQNAVIITMAAATANISISVTLGDADTAAKVANAIAVAVLERAKADPILAAQLVSTAVPTTIAAGPDKTVVFGAGALGAGAAGGALWLLAERYHRRRATVVRGIAHVGARPDSLADSARRRRSTSPAASTTADGAASKPASAETSPAGAGTATAETKAPAGSKATAESKAVADLTRELPVLAGVADSPQPSKGD